MAKSAGEQTKFQTRAVIRDFRPLVARTNSLATLLHNRNTKLQETLSETLFAEESSFFEVSGVRQGRQCHIENSLVFSVVNL
jgi:hypothetical protein